jgi:RNA polymerase sigma-70 factor (ECF subfamily)
MSIGLPRLAVPAASPPEPPTRVRSRDSEIASAVKALMAAGARDRARERFAELVGYHQRRAGRIAYHYLRNEHDADEAVQDAFLKVFTHIGSYREDLPFEMWFTRILINQCLDVRKARARRLRWVLPLPTAPDGRVSERPVPAASIESRLIVDEQCRAIGDAVGQLPERQRDVFTLSHLGQHSTSEIGQLLGLSEATVRVHLFRAVRRLRGILGIQAVGA